ncbi:hypothetical protein HK104_001983 [Borealophlyctis nickersoniae]|nr:hypothetical protein HK104_001983 [Borealophlyctis nickersoniae]
MQHFALMDSPEQHHGTQPTTDAEAEPAFLVEPRRPTSFYSTSTSHALRTASLSRKTSASIHLSSEHCISDFPLASAEQRRLSLTSSLARLSSTVAQTGNNASGSVPLTAVHQHLGLVAGMGNENGEKEGVNPDAPLSDNAASDDEDEVENLETGNDTVETSTSHPSLSVQEVGVEQGAQGG